MCWFVLFSLYKISCLSTTTKLSSDLHKLPGNSTSTGILFFLQKTCRSITNYSAIGIFYPTNFFFSPKKLVQTIRQLAFFYRTNFSTITNSIYEKITKNTHTHNRGRDLRIKSSSPPNLLLLFFPFFRKLNMKNHAHKQTDAGTNKYR